MFSISEIDSIIEKSVFSLDLKGDPVELYSPMEYLISLGGKRLRPKIAVLTYNLFSDKIDRSIIYPAMGLEIFHGFTLIHDDIMDKAPLRRGRESVHKKWNNNIAILSGDVMCIKSYQYIAEAPAIKLKEVLDLFSKTAAQVCEGQQYDMNYESLSFITMEDYISMITLKTAVLIAASAKMGAIIANAPVKVCESLYNWGLMLGLAFQIKDDYFDCYGSREIFGKQIGGDIIMGKKNWLLAESYKRANLDKRRELQELYKNHDLNSNQKITAVLAIFSELGIKEAAEEAMEYYRAKAKEALQGSTFNKEQLEQLYLLTDSVINREN